MVYRTAWRIATIGLAVLAGCHDPSGSVSPTNSPRTDRTRDLGAPSRIIVTPRVNLLRTGWTQPLTATVLDEAGNPIVGATVSWRMDDDAVGSVTSAGLLVAGAGGTANVIARVDGRSSVKGTATVIVVNDRSRLSSGANYSCALSASDLASCWGSQDYGQLGTGSATWSASPTQTVGAIPFVTIVAGDRVSCGLTAAGATYCWGGEIIGSGALARVLAPTRVAPLLVFRNLYANAGGVCGLTSRGQAICWGTNFNGELGTGDKSLVLSPTAVVQGWLQFVSLAVGHTLACGLTASGVGYCWGTNSNGQLGTGTNVDALVPSSPVAAPVGTRFVALTAGQNNACGLTTTGDAYCWGWNPYGQVGNDLGDTRAPLRVSGGLTLTQLNAKFVHTCGIAVNGSAYCWGYNADGQIGDGTIGDSFQHRQPTRVASGMTFARVAAGYNHTCGQTSSGAFTCWGQHFAGQIGNGVFGYVPSPTPIAGGGTFTDVSAGAEHACGLTATGAAFCWGANFNSKLGVGSTLAYGLTPTAVAQRIPFTAISTGAGHTCALGTDAKAYCWGDNNNLQIGHAGATNLPGAVDGVITFAGVAAGAFHSCGWTTAGLAYCWGRNWSGQLGDGTSADRAAPNPVAQGSLKFTRLSIGGGGQHTCGITDAGTVYCWGANSEGQLGDNSTTNRQSPTQVSVGAFAFTDVAAGSANSCARTLDGSMYCWGANYHGQGGSGSNVGQLLTPMLVAGSHVFAKLPARLGAEHACALDVSGTTWCWGRDVEAQLGRGASVWGIPGASPSDANSPMQVSTQSFVGVMPGGYFTCALAATARVFCWGSDQFHQLGTGTVFITPTAVSPFGP